MILEILLQLLSLFSIFLKTRVTIRLSFETLQIVLTVAAFKIKYFKLICVYLDFSESCIKWSFFCKKNSLKFVIFVLDFLTFQMFSH